jgi:hypothetical protein
VERILFSCHDFFDLQQFFLFENKNCGCSEQESLMWTCSFVLSIILYYTLLEMVTTISQVAAGKDGRRAKDISDANAPKKKKQLEGNKDNKVDDLEDLVNFVKSRNSFFVRKF